jgi:hypothetical protein
MNFQRGQDPLQSMGIGYAQKREFSSIKEASDWAILFPAEYTDGQIQKWTKGMVNNGKLEIPAGPNTGWLQMVKWMKDNARIPSLFGNEKIGLKEAKNIIDIVRESVPLIVMKGENLIVSYKSALNEIYEHVGFNEKGIAYPIDDRTDKVWSLIGDSAVRYAETEEKLLDEAAGEYYEDKIYKQRFYTKWVYEGNDLTMIFCDPLFADGMKYFGVFSNAKRVK